MSEKISIIVLNYNGEKFLTDCVKSVLSQSYSDFELIVFDNNSADGSIKLLRDNFSDSRVRIVESDKNLGFAGGNLEAMKYCSNDLIVLLNNDTKADRDWLKFLAEAVSEGNTVASSFVRTVGIPEEFYTTNGSVSYLMYNIMNVFENPEDEFYPNGCSVIFRKSEISEPFDADYFYYSEDVYLGLKARFRGMKIRFVKDSLVQHFGGGSESPGSMKTYYSERNRLLNVYLFFSLWTIIRFLPYIAFNHSAKLLLSLLSSKYSFPGLLKAYLWFYFNIPGIIKKRKELHKEFNTGEKEVISKLTCKVFNGNSFPAALVNRLSYYYSRTVGLKPIEFFTLSKK